MDRKKTSRYIVNTEVNSALYPSAVGKSNTDYRPVWLGLSLSGVRSLL